MELELEQVQRHYAESLQVIRKCFPMENRQMFPPCAGLFASRGMTAEAEALMRAKELVRDRIGAFSSLRGWMFVPLCCSVALSPRPEEKLDSVHRIYKALRSEFMADSRIALTALVLSDLKTPEGVEEGAAHAKELYRVFRKKHVLLTGYEDAPYAILMAFSGRNEERMLEEMDACFDRLHPFALGDRIQSVSEVLALSDLPADRKCDRFLELYDALKSAGYRIWKRFGLPVLAGLSVLDVPVETLTGEVARTDAFLKPLPLYRSRLTFDSAQRHVHALMLVRAAHGEPAGSDLENLVSALTLITMQLMLLIAVTNSAAVWATAHS